MKKPLPHASSSVLPSGHTRERVSLGLGAVVIVDRPSIVRTVLGSCVAVILHVPRLQVSAVCHAQLPGSEDGSCSHDAGACSDPSNLKYVTCCIGYMLTDLRRRGVANLEIVCTLIGGANVIQDIDPRWSVGDLNVARAVDLLEGEGIKVACSDTGGTRARVVEHMNDRNRTKVRYHGRPTGSNQ